MWFRPEFERRLKAVLPDYVRHNDWFNGHQYTPGTRQRNNPDRFRPYINAAWLVYNNVGNLGLNFILLGDTEIRKETQLLKSFGILSSNTQPQEDSVTAKVEEAVFFRKVAGARATTGAYSPKGIVSTTETGSILSTQNWSPMLNDSMIISGASRGLDFCYTLNESEAESFRKIQLIYGTRNANAQAFPGGGANRDAHIAQARQQRQQRQQRAETVWQAYFKSNPHALWKGGLPRVFIRELLGLIHFGYQAIVDEQQINFVAPAALNPGNIGFAGYLGYLQQSGYFTNQRDQLIDTISNYLFQDAEALSTLKGRTPY